jgi:hypothetical protein
MIGAGLKSRNVPGNVRPGLLSCPETEQESGGHRAVLFLPAPYGCPVGLTARSPPASDSNWPGLQPVSAHLTSGSALQR